MPRLFPRIDSGNFMKGIKMHAEKIQVNISIMYLANYLYIIMKSMYHNYTFYYNDLSWKLF